jgi:hypothetical protein
LGTGPGDLGSSAGKTQCIGHKAPGTIPRKAPACVSRAAKHPKLFYDDNLGFVWVHVTKKRK